jgi:hypothetical protein
MNRANLTRLINSLREAASLEEGRDYTDLIACLSALDDTTSNTPSGQALIAEALDICLI